MSIYDEPEPFVSPRILRARRALNVVLAAAIRSSSIVGSVAIVEGVAEAILGQCTPPWLAGTDPQICLNAQISQGTSSCRVAPA